MGINTQSLLKDGDKLYAVVVTVEGAEATLATKEGVIKLDAGLVTAKEGGRVYFDAEGNVIQTVANKAKPATSTRSGSTVDHKRALASVAMGQ